MSINWGLGVMPDIGGNALAAFERGRERRQQADAQAAMGAYAANPTPEGLNALAPHNPQFVMQERRAREQQAAQQQQQRRADLPTVTRLLEYAQDEPTYQQARATAQEYGIDTSTLPPNFDPAWRDQQLATMRILQTPQGQEALSTAGKIAVDMGFKPGTPEYAAKVTELWTAESTKLVATQAGGGVASVAPGQPAQFVIQPNDGSQPVGAPVSGGPQPGTVEDGYRFKGGNPADPSAWEPVGQGGGAPSRVTAGFLGGL